ncbi:MAG: Clp protease N-terminal domain-containing protein, partial [Flavobacteriales bacterium]
MEAKWSPQVRVAVEHSREEALRLGHGIAGIEHLLLALIRDPESAAVRILQHLDVDLNALRKRVETSIRSTTSSVPTHQQMPLTKQAERALKLTYLEAKHFRAIIVGTEHLLLSILKDEDNVASKHLNAMGVTHMNVRDEVSKMEGSINPDDLPRADHSASDDDDDERGIGGGGSGIQKKSGDSKSKTPVLDNFGRDLTKLAEEGKLDPIVGREKEIERVSQVLSRRKKNNPILIGEPGV